MIGRLALASLVLVLWAALPAGAQVTGVPPALQAPNQYQVQFDAAKALFDTFEYQKSIAAFDELIAALVAAEGPQAADMLVQALELRGRAKFSLGDAEGATQDFAALLSLRPEFRLPEGVSPRIVAAFDEVRAATVGHVFVTMTPPGDLEIGRRVYTVPAEGVTIDLTAGDHQLVVNRRGFTPVSQLLAITAGESRELTLALERISASLEVQTTEPGVEVVLDGTPRGETTAAAGGIGTLMLEDLPLGSHRLVLRRECYVDAERTISLVADDVRTDPIPLERAVATVTVNTRSQGAMIFVDGESRGPAPGEVTICQGDRLLEVRGPTGRFVDRRTWRAGARETVDARLRSAFPIVSVTGDTAQTMLDQLGSEVARVLGPAERVLVYAPDAAQLQEALRAENIPAGWLADVVAGSPSALPRDVIRDMGRRLAARLGVQGFTAVVAGSERFQATVGLLAAGSGEPEIVRFTTADQASPRAAIDRLGAPLPPIVRPSTGLSVVDLAGLEGAAVVRSSGPAADAGIAAGDLVIAAAGAPIASVAALRAVVAQGAGPVTLSVLAADGTSRDVAVTPAAVADLLPLRDSAILYNRALLELQELTQTATSPQERAAAHLNLAIVLLRLGSFDEALQSLGQARLDDGIGVPAGAVAYLRGLALEGVGRTAEAQAAFTEAAAATDARLGIDGPLVSPLARAKAGAGGGAGR